MNVTKFSLEKRKELFEKWIEDNKSSKGYKDSYLLFGNDIDISKEDLENPHYKLIEWNGYLPSWMKDMSSKIGENCESTGIKGIFIGFTASYEDYYYRIQKDNGDIELITCVADIHFENNKIV